MFAAKSYQVTRPGFKKPKPKKKKLASVGAALSARSGSTGSLPAYPTPRQAAGRQRSLTADQPRLRRAQLDSRVRESAALSRPGRRLAPPATQPSRQLQLADRLPTLRARIAEMKALASFFPDSEVSVSDNTASDTRTNIASILKLRNYEQNAVKTRRKPFKPAGAAAAAAAAAAGQKRIEAPVRGRRTVSGPGRDSCSQPGSPPRPAAGSIASSSEHRDHRHHRGRSVLSDERDPPDYHSDDHDRPRQRGQPERSGHRSRQPDRLEHRSRQPDRLEHRSREPDRLEHSSEDRDRLEHRSRERDRLEHSSEDRDRLEHRSRDRGMSGRQRGEQGRGASRKEERVRPAPAGEDCERAACSRSESQPSGVQADVQETASNPPIDPLKLLAPLQIPNLNDMMAGSGNGSPRNLQDVIKNFLWAKQQASATASVMSDLRSLVEDGSGQAASESAAVQGVPAAEATERPDTASSAASLASSAGTTYLLPGDSKSQLASSSKQLASSSKQLASRGLQEGGSEAGSALRSVSEAGLQSGALHSVQSGGLPSTQSGAIQSSQSGALQSDQSGLQSGQDVTASHEQLEVRQLRTQFQLQQTKLKQIEQKNYVLSLAVEGQEKTIRTMTNELQDARDASREERQPPASAAQLPSLQAALSAQSWPIGTSKTELAVEDNSESRRELERLTAVLESKEHELNILKAYGPAKELKSFSVGKPRVAQTISSSHHLDQVGLCDGWRSRLEGVTQTRSSPLYRAAADPGRDQPTPLRRHSFTGPPARGAEEAWLGAPAGWRPRLGQAAAASCQSTPLAGPCRPRPWVGLEESPAPPHATTSAPGYVGQQSELRKTVQESLSRVRQLETELEELRCSRDRDRDRGDFAAESSLLGELAGPGEPAAGAGRLCKPFPQIVRMTEVKLQQTYHSLVAEQNKNKLLNKALHEVNTRLEQHTSQTEKLKERLASSVEERRHLQTCLSAAEAGCGIANNKQQQLSEELQRRTELLAQASQYLDERIDQVAALSRELDATRAEAAHEARLADERLSQMQAHSVQLEARSAKQQAENRLLRQASAETDQLTQTGRRLRQRVLDLTDKLERSITSGKMLENYVLFLKASYSKMFGAATPATGLDVPTSLRDLLEQAETQ